MSKMGNTQIIHHRPSTHKLVIKDPNKGDEQITVDLTTKQEVCSKDRSGHKVISVFKWNRSTTELIEFRLIELKGTATSSSSNSKSSRSSSSNSRRRSRQKQVHKSYTESRWLDDKGQMVVAITNQIGKRCTSIYVKEEEESSTSQIAHVLGIESVDDHHTPNGSKSNKSLNANAVDAADPLSTVFPLDIVRLVESASSKHSVHSAASSAGSSSIDIVDDDDDEKLNEENIAIQREIQRIGDEIAALQKELDAKTQELRRNIARNDERIERNNLIRKWKEFESEWTQWDSLSLIGWLHRQRLQSASSFTEYGPFCTLQSIDRFCSMRFGAPFCGQFMGKMNVDAIRGMGIDDDADCECIMAQMEALMERYPPQSESECNIPGADLKAFLNGLGLMAYFEVFSKHGFEDLNMIREFAKHKGMDYVERNVISKKLKINNMAHRMQIMEGLQSMMQREKERETQITADDTT